MLSPELTIFLVAMSPIVELRGAIPLALKVYGLSFWPAFWLSVLGNLLPMALIVIFFKPISVFLSDKCHCFKNIFDWIFTKTRNKTEKLHKFGKNLTVLILTAIPIPLIGGWTGALAAILLEVPVKKSIILMFFGLIVAGIIVSYLTLGLVN